MEVFLQTDRLVLRQFATTDADHLVELDNDPEVMRYIGARRTTREHVRQKVIPRMLADYGRGHGYGYYAAADKATGRFLGWFELRPRNDDPPGDVELGYRLRRAVWGRGYATEGALALIRRAFTDLGATRVYAETMAVNAGSRRVMEKAGLRYVRTFHEHFDDPLPGTEHGEVRYELHKADWERGAGTGGPGS